MLTHRHQAHEYHTVTTCIHANEKAENSQPVKNSTCSNADMTSTELKDALSRRLKKIDATGGETSHENRTDVSPPHGSEHPSSQSADAKDMNQLYRSGWNATAPIPRSTALPAPPPMFPSPMKSDSVPRKVCHSQLFHALPL